MPDLTKIKLSLAHAGIRELVDLRAWINNRIATLRERAYEATKKDAWERVRAYGSGRLPEPVELHICFDGFIPGSSLDRGDVVYLHHVQPRAKRAWFSTSPDGPPDFWMDAAGLVRYNVQDRPVADPPSADERAARKERGDAIADRLTQALS